MRWIELLYEDLEGQKAKRGEFIIQTYGKVWQGLPGFDSIEEFVDKLGEIDPSLKGIYMPWIAKLAIKNPDLNKTEDLSRLAQDLTHFEEFKAKLEKKDINAYKSFDEVFNAVEPFLKPQPKTPEQKKAERELAKQAKVREDIVDVYNGPEGWVKIPTTQAASCFLGQNTRWCTAARGNNMFNNYNKSDRLFVIYDKATRTRHQLHIQSGQFMDVKDQRAEIDNFPVWARMPIVKWYKENNPSLTLKQLLFLKGWAGEEEDIVTGSGHEDIMDLMKQYGVV